MKGTQVSCQDEVQDTRFLQKADKRQITQVHVNSLKQAQTAMTGILLGSLVPLTVMGFWEHSWQSVADCAVLVGSWFTGSVYYLAPCPDHAAPVPLFFPPSPGCRRASGVRRASPRSAVSSDRDRKALSPLTVLSSSSSPPGAYFEGLSV